MRTLLIDDTLLSFRTRSRYSSKRADGIVVVGGVVVQRAGRVDIPHPGFSAHPICSFLFK